MSTVVRCPKGQTPNASASSQSNTSFFQGAAGIDNDVASIGPRPLFQRLNPMWLQGGGACPNAFSEVFCFLPSLASLRDSCRDRREHFPLTCFLSQRFSIFGTPPPFPYYLLLHIIFKRYQPVLSSQSFLNRKHHFLRSLFFFHLLFLKHAVELSKRTDS